MQHKIYIYVICIILILSSNVYAKDHHDVILSVDNHIGRSKNIATDISYSGISTLAYLGDHYNLNDNTIYRLGLVYGTLMVSLLNHEISGHGFRLLEFGYEIEKITIGPFSGSVQYTMSKPCHIQKQALISLGGNEINYLLSQKIFNNIVINNQQIDPISGAGYMFSAGNQLFYVYNTPTSMPGHDLVSYARYMELLYGKDSMSMNKIRSVAFLDMLDPVMLGSVYSMITGNHVDVPKIKLNDQLSVTPFARAILTPYGVIEKQFGTYIFTDYTQIKLAFSYGVQSKKNEPVMPNNASHYLGVFKGLNANETIQNQKTYSIYVSVLKLFEIGHLAIGMDSVFWRQPELFVEDPYRAQSKNGYMFMINGSYKASDSIQVLAKAGYKTKGFVPGYDIAKTPMFSLGIRYKL